MTRLMNFFTRTAPWLAKALTPNFKEVFSVKGGRPMVDHLIRMVYLLRDGVTPAYVRICISFLRDVVSIYRKSGMKFLVKYLKTCQLLLIQAAGNQRPRFDSRYFGAAVSTTASGLPRIIPKTHRAFIRASSSFHIKFWMTLFGLFRVLPYPSKPKIATIIQPGVRLSNSLMGEWLGACDTMIAFIKPPAFTQVYEPRDLPSRGSTSSSVVDPKDSKKTLRAPSSHISSILLALVTWRNLSVQFGMVEWSLKVAGTMANFVKAKGLARLFVSLGYLTPLLASFPYQPRDLGRLAFKDEPAGKVRVFAMVDAFTQWMLTPLHKYIFSLLRLLPSDATFDQLGSVERFTKQLTARGTKSVYSLDLTAATDRLPLSLQTILLGLLLDERTAMAWAALLVARWYTLPTYQPNVRATTVKALGVEAEDPFLRCEQRKLKSPDGSERSELFVTAVTYAVGQPMGARSSWAMLALTHHCIVWMAMARSGVRWYPGLYLVLGDDIVIADEAVALSYLEIMAELGCPINLSKSLVSQNGSFEFAKRFVHKGVDVSPVSWRELFVSYVDVSVLLTLVSKHRPRVSSVLAMMGHGYKAISRMTAHFSEMSRSESLLLLWLSRPDSIYSTFTSWTQWMLSIGFNSFKPDLLELSPTIKFMAKLALDLLRGIYPKDLVKSADHLRKVIEKYFSDSKLVPVLANMLWTSVFEYLYNHMMTVSFESRGAAQRMIQAALKSRTWEGSVESLDAFFTLYRGVENEAQTAQEQIGDNDFVDIDRVITLNRCTELKWAEMVRKSVPILRITPRRKYDKRPTVKV
jgi:hypothetical protein